MLKKCNIRIEGFGLIKSDPGHIFLDVLDQYNIDLHNDCGGIGKCGKCRMIFLSEPPEPLKADHSFLSPEEIESGMRLSCFHQIRNDCELRIPDPPQLELMDDLPDDFE